MATLCCLWLLIDSNLPKVAYMETRKVNGTAILVIREALGISHGILAKRAHISPSFLTRIESGERQTQPPKAKRIAAALGVPLEAITYPAFTSAENLESKKKAS